MKRPLKLGLTAILTAGFIACGGSDSPDAAPAASQPAATPTPAPAPREMTVGMPDWYHLDNAAKTVELHIAAEMDGGWKYNGMSGGENTITVPLGYQITIEFTNDDPSMAHSLSIDSKVGGYPAMFTDPAPAFPGAMTSNPTSMTDATLPGESETLRFTADKAGNYAMVCYIPGHAVTGMWVHFNVGEGEPGVTM